MAKNHSLDFHIIVRGSSHVNQDAYANRFGWVQLGEYRLRETRDDKQVSYQFLRSQNGSGNIASATLIGKHGIERVAYIEHARSEDFSLQRELSKMLGIKLKRKRGRR